MKRAIGLVAFAAIVGISGQSYAIDPYPYYDQDQLRYRDMSVPTGGQIIEGDVTRVDPDSYVIRDLSGRDVRVYFEPGTLRDNITVGDHVIVRFDRPSAPYATSKWLLRLSTYCLKSIFARSSEPYSFSWISAMDRMRF